MVRPARGSDPSRPRRLRPALWILAAIAVFLGVAWASLALLLPPARVRGLVEQQVGAMLAREVRFEDAKLALWPPVRLTVRNPALAEPGGFANGAAIEARSLHLDLNVLALLARRIVIHRFELVEPSAHIVLRRDGTTNLDRLAATTAPSRPATPMDFAVSRLEIERGRVVLDDVAASRRTVFQFRTRTGFAIEGGSRVSTEGASRFSDVAFGPLAAARLSDLNRALAGLEWNVEHRAALDLATRQLSVRRLALRLGRAELALAGAVDLSAGNPAVDLRARGSGIDLGQVLDYLSAASARSLNGIKGGGRLDFDLGIRGRLGPASRPALAGAFAVKDLAFRYPGAPVGVERTSFTARLTADSLVIPDLSARISGQPVRGHVELTRFADPQVDFGLRGDLDLAAIARLLAPRETELLGRVALDVSGRGRAKDPGSMALEGWLRAAKAGVKSPLLPKALENIQGEVQFSAARARVKGLSVHAGQSSFTLDATMTRPLALLAKRAPDGNYAVPPAGVEFTLQSPYLDLAELLPAAPGGPILSNARGTGRVSIARLRNKRLDVQNVAAEIALEPGVLEVPRFGMNAYGGGVTGRARFDSRDPAQPAIGLQARVDSCRTDEILGAWTGAGKLVRGAVNTNLDLSVQGLTPDDVRRTLTAQGLALLVNGTIGPAPALEEIARVTRTPAFREVSFRDCRVPFRVENGRVAIGPAKLEGSLGEWQVSGATGFDGSLDYAVSITLPPEVTARLGAGGALAAGALADGAGRVLIDLHVGGNAKNPSVRLDERAMRERLLGRVSRALSLPMPHFAPPPGDTTRGAADSVRAAQKRYQRALEDSLRNTARRLFKDFFGTRKDTTRP
jgi:hypothetical protein